MTELLTTPHLMLLPVFFVGGVVLGFAYFRTLRITADLLVRGDSPLLGLALTLGRVTFLGLGLYVAVLSGGLALLAALAGVLCAKALVLALARSDGE